MAQAIVFCGGGALPRLFPVTCFDLFVDWKGADLALSLCCPVPALYFWALVPFEAMSSTFIQRTLSGHLLYDGHGSGSGQKQEINTLGCCFKALTCSELAYNRGLGL